MKSEEKIRKVLEIIKAKADIAPNGATIEYRAGKETFGLSTQDEISILTQLSEEGAIEVVGNFGSEYV